MSGKPAARITDSVSGSKIVSGSRTVLIGSQGGVACSECPGGVTVGNPVSPSQGAKVLMGEPELDFALPGAMPLVWQRQYSSYVNLEHGAPCSLLGYGWSLPAEMRIELRDEACILFTAMGRAITFDPLPEGGSIYSPSEDIWLLRGGPDATWGQLERFRHIPRNLAGDPQCIMATDGAAGTFWVLGPGATPSEQTRDPAAPPGMPYALQCMFDRFGRRQRYERDAWGRVVGIVDGVGRRYRLNLRQLHAARAAQGLWQADSGWRLTGVDLVSDPWAPGASEPIALVRYGYSDTGDLVTVHDRAGRLVREFAWQAHLMTAHRHLGGPRHSYRYESLAPGARVVEHANEEGLTYRFEYMQTDTGKTTQVTDSLQRVDVYRFEGEAGLSRLVEHVRADGSMVRYAYDAAGRMVEAVDPLGRTTRLRYDGEGRLLGSQDADGTQSSQDHDPATGHLLAITDAVGGITRLVYDAWGRRTQIVLPDGSIQRDEYAEPQDAPLTCDLPVRRIDARGGVVQLAWSPAGQLVGYTDCSGHTSETQYDRWGQRIQRTDALGRSVRYDHDLAGNLKTVHRADGSTIRYSHDAAGRILQVLPVDNEPGHGVGFAYDLWGRVTRRWQDGYGVQYDYDIAGRLVQLTNENGAHAHFAWDAMDRQVSEEGFDGRLQTYRYDAAGQLIEATDGTASGSLSTRYAWDAMSRLAEIHVPATEHSPARVERLQWNPAGQLIAARSYLLGPGQLQQLHTEALTERDALGRPTAETQRLYKLGEPGGAASPTPPDIEFEHTISHRLDALGNRQASELQDLGQVDYLMYGSGHLHGLLYNGQGLLDIERDALHREVRRQQRLPMDQVVQTHREWNVLGRLSSLSIVGVAPADPVPGSGSPFPLVGQLTRRAYRYDVLGQLEAVQAAGDAERYRYDTRGRLIAAQSASRQQHWHFDPAGNRLPSTEADLSPSGPFGRTDNWKALVRGQWKEKSFNVLDQGEVPQSGPEALNAQPRWHDNRVGHGDDTAYLYDSRGNRVEAAGPDDRRLVLRYDGANRLVEAQTQGRARTIVSRYVYDTRGRRLRKIVTERVHGQGEVLKGRTYHGWDGDRLVHTERLKPGLAKQVTHTVYEPGGFAPLVRLSMQGNAPPTGLAALLAQAVNPQMQQGLRDAVNDLPPNMRQSLEEEMQTLARNGMPAEAQRMLAQQAGGDAAIASVRETMQAVQPVQSVAVHHFHCDHMGTPQALTNEAGQLVWMARYDPWGNLQQEYNPHGIEQPIRLPGQHHDAETGLHYNRHRYYDPVIGSYINQDPIGLKGGINGFAYARQDPLQVSDPLGLYADAAHADMPLFNGPGDTALPGGIDGDLGRPAPSQSKNCPDCTQVAGKAGDYVILCFTVLFLSLGLKVPPRPPPPPPTISEQEKSLKGRGGKNCS
ncbi:RHS repeat-associated core domain-containing protein [Variovorax sp. AFSI2.2]|uniref:RHS repeat-associated core domain-containing protein n=1 Tax=Variovorax sp. AFSI2.2 TaxID=3384160 RepID=UPI003EB7C31F